jgi:hypothetical protein
LADDVISPVPGNPGEECVTVPIREVPGIIELLERRQRVPAAVRQSPAHPHGGLGRLRSYRQVFGHAFDEPKRQHTGGGQCARAGRPSVPGNVVLKCVDKLVPDHMVQIG